MTRQTPKKWTTLKVGVLLAPMAIQLLAMVRAQRSSDPHPEESSKRPSDSSVVLYRCYDGAALGWE